MILVVFEILIFKGGNGEGGKNGGGARLKIKVQTPLVINKVCKYRMFLQYIISNQINLTGITQSNIP